MRKVASSHCTPINQTSALHGPDIQFKGKIWNCIPFTGAKMRNCLTIQSDDPNLLKESLWSPTFEVSCLPPWSKTSIQWASSCRNRTFFQLDCADWSGRKTITLGSAVVFGGNLTCCVLLLLLNNFIGGASSTLDCIFGVSCLSSWSTTSTAMTTFPNGAAFRSDCSGWSSWSATALGPVTCECISEDTHDIRVVGLIEYFVLWYHFRIFAPVKEM